MYEIAWQTLSPVASILFRIKVTNAVWLTSFWLYQAGRSGGELILSKLTFLLILVRFVQSKHLGQLMLSAIEVKLKSFSAHLSTGKCCSGSGTSLPFRPMRRAWFLRLVTSHSPAQAGGHCGNYRQLPPASCPELGALFTGSGIQTTKEINATPSRSDEVPHQTVYRPPWAILEWKNTKWKCFKFICGSPRNSFLLA